MSADVQPDGLPPRARFWACVAMWLALIMAVVDSSIANVALPTIAKDLHTQAAASIWVVNAYQLAIVVALLPLATLGEIITFRRVFLAGLLLFVLASIGCCFAGSLAELTFARAVQGLGAAGVMAVNPALVRFTYPAAQLGRGVGFNALVISVAAVIGPSLASLILAHASWPWLFAVNVPTGVAALAVGLFALPQNPRAAGRLDRLSTCLNVIAYGGTVLGLDMLIRGGAILSGAAILGIGIAAGWLLVRRSLPQTRPLIPIDLLRNRLFALSVATSFASFIAQTLAFLSVPFLLQLIMHRTQVETGLLITAWPLATGVAAPFAGRLADRYPAALLGGIGLGLFGAGLALLATMPADAPAVAIVWRLALCGLGFGVFQPPNNRTMLSAAPRERTGAAGGMLATARLSGQTAGATLAAILLGLSTQGLVWSLWLGAAVAMVGALISLSRLRLSPPPR
jgi:MFS transporter, DHA2 family, multidrug resistance protein